MYQSGQSDLLPWSMSVRAPQRGGMGSSQNRQRREDLEEEKEGEKKGGNQKKRDRKHDDKDRMEDRGRK
jgi:hypothetical protein